MNRTLKVIVIGAGIGGLATARALRQRGLDAQVYEQAPVLGEVGAGVQMSPNAVKVLAALGLTTLIQKSAFRSRSIVGKDWRSGRRLYTTPLAGACEHRYGAEYLHMHRADLHTALSEGFPTAALHLSARCQSVEQDANCVVAHFADGSSVEGDLLVGADGIHSMVRAALFEPEAPCFTGNMCWRTTIQSSRIPKNTVPPDVSIWLGPNGHVVTYFVRGGSLLNVVAIRETEAWVEESWNVPSSTEELITSFSDWNPGLLDLFRQGEAVYKWGLFDREPMAQWSIGRATLLGDAAHPMLPFLAQGAAMALEDGYVISKCIAENRNDPAFSLQAYEKIRRPRTTQVQLRSRAQGREAHLASPLARLKRDIGYRIKEVLNPQSTGLKGEWLYEYDATV